MRNEPTEPEIALPPQIDLRGSPLRKAGLLALSIGFVVLCVWMLVDGPQSGRRSVAPGSFGEFALYLGIVVFGVFAAILAFKLLQFGTLVSVGPRGIFDRRLSSDWIPWSAILAIATTQLNNQPWLTLHLDPEREPALPLRKRARFLKRLNERFGFRGYSISASELRGGFPALADAVQRTQPMAR